MTPLRTAKPLSGLRVLVPRGGEWGNAIAATLRLKGATPVIAPMINFASTENAAALVDALARLQSGAFDWIVVTSATTVDVLMSHEVKVPEATRIAAVGETTGSALALAGYRVDFAPDKDNSTRGLVKEWPSVKPSGRVLIPQSDVPEENLVAGLEQLGLEAEFVTAYRTVGVPVAAEVIASVADGRIGAILVTSGSVARQIQAQLAPLPGGTVVASIGPRTAFDARAAGIAVDVIAESRTADALVDALVEHVRSLGA
ncbi:MAG TPA: uroporphyrinogen-III synthase [Terrimesophilobacter sp.]|jgi:Uroporphyrinogen-III synthase|uniref:uroporphyrinogen-III synthase n=1 Tax=Terrimesophilobacter sp. TaxID=2906435 RepID=UPI002F924E62